MRPFYKPGYKVTRTFTGYTPDQEAKYVILSDMAYAAAYGFAQTRLPTPGIRLDSSFVTARMQQVAKGWAYEAIIRPPESGYHAPFNPLKTLPPLAQQHYVQRLEPYPQTKRPWVGTNIDVDSIVDRG